MRTAVLLLACLIPHLAHGQITFGQVNSGASVPNAQSQGPRRTVTGTVTNAVTGEPIRKALVQMLGQAQGSALTGPDGRFRFDDVSEGQVLFFLQKPGFYDAGRVQRSEWANPDNRNFTVGADTNDFQLKLYPGGRIVGHITDSNGEPVENVMVQVLAEQIQQGRKQWQNRNMSNTDDDGAFKIDDLTPGRYIVFSGAHMLPSVSFNAPHDVSPPMYYPDASDTASAQTIDLQPGQEIQADFRLRAERGYRVVAHVSGAPANTGVNIAIQNSNGQIISFDGVRFEANTAQAILPAIPSGTWALQANVFGADGQRLEARQEFTVDHSDVMGLQLVLHPPVAIPITVNRAGSNQSDHLSETNNSQDGRRKFIPRYPGIQVSLVSDHQSSFAMQQGNPPQMMFRDIQPGKYKLRVQPFSNECVESATYGGIDLTRDYLVVGSEGSTQPVTIDMGTDCATLNLTVKPSEHPPAMMYAVIVPSSSFAEPNVQPLPAQGVVPLTLSPGSYQIYVFSNLEGLEYANPEAMRNYPTQSVTVEASQKTDLTVEITERKKE